MSQRAIYNGIIFQSKWLKRVTSNRYVNAAACGSGNGHPSRTNLNDGDGNWFDNSTYLEKGQ